MAIPPMIDCYGLQNVKCDVSHGVECGDAGGVEVTLAFGNSVHHVSILNDTIIDNSVYLPTASMPANYQFNAIQVGSNPVVWGTVTFQWVCGTWNNTAVWDGADVPPVWAQECYNNVTTSGLKYDKIYIYYKGGRDAQQSLGDSQNQYWGMMNWLGIHGLSTTDAYHTIIGGGSRRWLDWATSTYTGKMNNAGTNLNGGNQLYSGDCDTTSWDGYGLGNVATFGVGDTLNWSHTSSTIPDFYCSTNAGLTTNVTNSGNTITSLGLPPVPAPGDEILIIIFDDEASCCYHGQEGTGNTVTVNGTSYPNVQEFNTHCTVGGDIINDGGNVWKADFDDHKTEVDNHVSGGGTMDAVMWPYIANTMMSNPKTWGFALHVAAAIHPGNTSTTTPVGVFQSNSKYYHPTLNNADFSPDGIPVMSEPAGWDSPSLRVLEVNGNGGGSFVGDRANPYNSEVGNANASLGETYGTNTSVYWTFPYWGAQRAFNIGGPETEVWPVLATYSASPFTIGPFSTQFNDMMTYQVPSGWNITSSCSSTENCITVQALDLGSGLPVPNFSVDFGALGIQITDALGYAYFQNALQGIPYNLLGNDFTPPGVCMEYLLEIYVGTCSFDPDVACDCGCDDPAANNYDPSASYYDPTECPCTYDILGCTDPTACNYDPSANQDDGTCCYPGCMDPTAANYNATACCDDGTCEHPQLPCDIAYGEYDPTEFLTDTDIKRIETEARFADDVYKHFQAKRFGMISPCENTLDGIATEKYLCYWQDKKEKEYTGYKIEREVFKPLIPGTPPAAGTFPNWVDPLCGLIPKGDLTIYFYYDGTSMGAVQAQNIHTASELWIQQLQADGFTGNHYHTIIAGERWLDWSIQAITGAWNNSGDFQSNTLVCSTNSAVTACNTPPRFCGAASVKANTGATGQCGCHGDTTTPNARMGNTQQVQDWAQNGDCTAYFYDSFTKGVQCDTWANTAGTAVYTPIGPSITWNGPPPPVATEQVLIVLFADEAQGHNTNVSNDPYYYSYHQSGGLNGTANDWNLASQNGPADVFKADYNFYIDTYNEFTSRSCNHKMHCFAYPIRPGAPGPYSSHRPFPLSVLGPIASGNRPSPDGTFLAGTAPVNTLGTLLAAEIAGSNIYWNTTNTVTQHAYGYGGLDHYGWGGNFTSPSVTPTLDPNVLVSDLNSFFSLGLYQCNDTECLVFDVVNQIGNSIQDYQIYLDGKDVGKTNEFGRYTHIISQASVNKDHTVQLCTCITTSGDCAQQRILITATELCLDPVCTVPDPQCTCNAPGNLQVIPTAAGTGALLQWTVTNSSETTITYDIRYRKVNTTTPNTWIEITGITGTSYNLTGLLPLTDYEFQVRSVCGILTSDWNANQIFTTLDPCPTIECMLATCNSLTSYNLIYQYASMGALTTANTGTWGIVWGTNADITLDNIVAGGSTSTIMVPATPSTYPGEAVVNTLITEIATGLAEATQYYWRAYIIDHNIAGCGSNPVYSNICDFVSIADVCNIPDNNFEQALMDLGHKPQGAYTGTIPHVNVNTITTLNVSSYNIASLQGIECFTLLEHLECQTNVLTSLNISQNVFLTFLNCDGNQLTTLNTTSNTALLTLHCDTNQITSLGLTTNTALTYLDCGQNQITILNLAVNTALTYVACDNNNITTLDLTTQTALTTLRCNDNPPLSFLDVTNGNNNPNMPTGNFHAENTLNLDCINVDDPAYSTTNWPAPTYTDAGDTYGNPCVAATYCNIPDANFFASLQTQYPAFTYVGTTVLDTDVAALTTLDLTMTMIPDPNGIADMTGIECFTGLQILKVGYNQITSLNLQFNTALYSLQAPSNQIGVLDISQNILLTSITVNSNLLNSLDVTPHTVLDSLKCSFNQLTSLDVSQNTALNSLYCVSNQITSIDVTNNVLLTVFQISNNLLSVLQVNVNVLLIHFVCTSNQISTLDVTNNIALDRIQFGYNLIDCVDLSNATVLTLCHADHNPNLTTLNVQNGNNIAGINLTSEWNTLDTPLLTCITVDDVAHSNSTWLSTDAVNVYNTVCIPNSCALPICNIPDANFRAYLTTTFGVFFDASFNTATAGLIGITIIDYDGNIDPPISDATGLECMPALTKIELPNNSLAAIDLSGNPLLHTLKLQSNNITSIDFSNNPLLDKIYVGGNQLTTININPSVTPILTYLAAGSNPLITMDVQNHTTLETLWIPACAFLTSVNTSNCTALEHINCHNQTWANGLSLPWAYPAVSSLTTLITTGCTALLTLEIDNNKLTGVDTSTNTALTTFFAYNNALTDASIDFTNNILLELIGVGANPSITELDVDANINLQTVMIGSELLTPSIYRTNIQCLKLDLQPNLVQIDTVGCEVLKSVNIKNGNNINIPLLTWSLNFTSCPLLSSITVDDVAYSTTNWTAADGFIDAGTTFGLVDMCLYTYIPDTNFQTYLTGIGKTFVGDYVLTSTIITVTALNLNNLGVTDFTGIQDFTALTTLHCGYNTGATSIDISNLVLLTIFSIQGNTGITSIDVSANTLLTSLDVQNTGITSLDATTLSSLTTLYCNDNALTSLNIKNGNNFTGLLPVNFDAFNNPSLTTINCDNATTALTTYTVVAGCIDATMTTWTDV